MSETENGAAANPSPAPQIAETKPAGPGAQLAAYRQERGLTIEQVASQLNLAPRQIQALENDNYAALPGLVIARGFVRTYAKLLKVDAAPLVAMVAEENPAAMDTAEMQRALAESLSGSELPKMRREPSNNSWMLAVPVLLVAVLGAWVAHTMGLFGGSSSTPPAAAENTQKALPPVAAAAPEPQEQASQEQAPQEQMQAALQQDTNAVKPAIPGPANAQDAAAKSAEPKSAQSKPTETKVADATAVAPKPVEAKPAEPKAVAPKAPEQKVAAAAPVPPKMPEQKVATPSLAAPKAPESKVAATPAVNPAAPVPPNAAPVADVKPAVPSTRNVVLKVNQDSWIEIKRADKTVLISRIVKAGSTEAFDITQPGTLVIGNAAGVDVTVRGKPLDMKTIAKTNVARVDLK
jgi:cytoskeleton protein RodZ